MCCSLLPLFSYSEIKYKHASKVWKDLLVVWETIEIRNKINLPTIAHIITTISHKQTMPSSTMIQMLATTLSLCKTIKTIINQLTIKHLFIWDKVWYHLLRSIQVTQIKWVIWILMRRKVNIIEIHTKDDIFFFNLQTFIWYLMNRMSIG